MARQLMRSAPVIGRTARATKRWTRLTTAGWRPLPDFLVIGAQKSGTTSIYHYLTQFSDVRRASRKELHYFDLHHERGVDWYRSQFPVASEGRAWVTGEATPSYLSHPAVPELVAALIPQARLVALLRNPVERAYSHFHHSRARGNEPLADFARALELEAERIGGAPVFVKQNGQRRRDLEAHSYVRRSTYAPQLRRWLDVFPASSLLVVIAEELFADPAPVVGRVRRHLGLAPCTEEIAFDRKNARIYQEMPENVRQRLADACADDVTEVERLLKRPTGWLL